MDDRPANLPVRKSYNRYPTRGRPGGTAKHTPTEYTRGQVVACKACGASSEETAALLGISQECLEIHYRKELDYGLLNAVTVVVQNVYKIASTGTDGPAVKAAMFFLEKRGGKAWAPAPLRVTGADGGPIQQITLNMSVKEAADVYARHLTGDDGL